MEGEVDWKQQYDELKHHVDSVVLPLLHKALKYVPEEDDVTSQPTSHPYENEIAPWESGYPLILRAATPEERQKLFTSVMKKINAEGKWVGAESGSNGHKRPQVGMATKRAREQQANGDRPKHIRKSRKTSVYQPTVPFPATHVVLVGNGFYPEEGDVGSHICHDASCVNVKHLVWETSNRNNRRENLCNKKEVCRCGLVPPCDFTLHKKD